MYMFVSKWIVFTAFTWCEPIFTTVFEFIPFFYLLTCFLKLRVVSENSEIHLWIYDRTFLHLRGFDPFDEFLKYNTGLAVLVFEKSTFILTEFFRLMTTEQLDKILKIIENCLLYTSPSPRDGATSRMPSSA